MVRNMSNQWNDERRTLLQALQNIDSADMADGAQADRIGPSYYPVAEHLRLLDPDVVLVVGPHGSGKTEIVRVLKNASLFDVVKVYAPAVRLPDGDSQWLPMYPAVRDGFEGIGLRTFMQTAGTSTEIWRDLWLAYLVRALHDKLDDRGRSDMAPLLAPEATDVEAIYRAFCELGTKPVVVMDRLDEQMEHEKRYLFAIYDELDTFGNSDKDLVGAGVSGLVALWAAYARRWRRIRAKLFLRTDMYERYANAGGADFAKLAAGRVELMWGDRDLCGQLLKRIANADAALSGYVQAVKGVSWTDHPWLGKIPELHTWQDARPVVERMVGAYMDTAQKKGLVYRWLLDRSRDEMGRGCPQKLVRLIGESARQELHNFGILKSPRLLEPSSLISAARSIF